VDLWSGDAFYTSNARELLEAAAPEPRPYAVGCHIGGPVQPTVPLATYVVPDEAAPGRGPDRLAALQRVGGCDGAGMYVGRLGDVLEAAKLEAEDRPAGPAGGGDGEGARRVDIYCGHAVWNRWEMKRCLFSLSS
jgi:hypothetical protein